MKYIRTAGGIYKVIEECFKPMENNMVFIPQEGFTKILKQSNTIEDLCNEFVRVSKSVHDFLISDDIPTKKFGDTEIYGAIWTEWGLKYVAKMNDKGELELL